MALPTGLRKLLRLRTIFLGIFAAGIVLSHAEEVPEAPARAREFAGAILNAGWKDLEPGLSVLNASATGVVLVAFRISDAKFSLAVAAQSDPKGEYVDAIGKRSGAVIAVNGGFFGESEKDGALFPVGLLRLANHNHGQEWGSVGGYLAMRPDRTEIRPTRLGSPDYPYVIQSKPVLIEPGGVWAMNTDNGLSRPRTLVCRRDGETVVVVAHGLGLSLFEAGWLLREPSIGGAFSCDSALALDGGGSTQLWVDGHSEFAVNGETRIHNALIVQRK
jgi:hypothetical protein